MWFGGWPVPVQPSVYSINRTEPKPWSAFLKPCILQLLLKNTQDNSIIVFVWILPHNFANYKCCWMKKENPREKHKIGYIGFRVLILLKHEMEKGNPLTSNEKGSRDDGQSTELQGPTHRPNINLRGSSTVSIAQLGWVFVIAGLLLIQAHWRGRENWHRTTVFL